MRMMRPLSWWDRDFADHIRFFHTGLFFSRSLDFLCVVFTTGLLWINNYFRNVLIISLNNSISLSVLYSDGWFQGKYVEHTWLQGMNKTTNTAGLPARRRSSRNKMFIKTSLVRWPNKKKKKNEKPTRFLIRLRMVLDLLLFQTERGNRNK